jgi:hypothetical protein
MTSEQPKNTNNNKKTNKATKNTNNNETNKTTKNTNKNRQEPGQARTFFRGAVTGLSFLQIFKQIGALIVGLVLVSIGIWINSRDDVPVTVVQATVSSVTWKGKNGCEAEAVQGSRGHTTIKWLCEVVATYNSSESEAKEEHSFKSVGDRYNENQNINLYRKDDGSMTNDDPNAWKSWQWFFIGTGLMIILTALFWLWICTQDSYLARWLCAAKTAGNILSATKSTT